MATIADILTIKGSSLLSTGPDAMVLDAARLMNERKIGSLPVLDENELLLGLISIGDLNAYQANDHERTIFVLQEYIYGRV